MSSHIHIIPSHYSIKLGPQIPWGQRRKSTHTCLPHCWEQLNTAPFPADPVFSLGPCWDVVAHRPHTFPPAPAWSSHHPGTATASPAHLPVSLLPPIPSLSPWSAADHWYRLLPNPFASTALSSFPRIFARITARGAALAVLLGGLEGLLRAKLWEGAAGLHGERGGPGERHCVGYARMEVLEVPVQFQEESPTAPLKGGLVLRAVLVVG